MMPSKPLNEHDSVEDESLHALAGVTREE